jgi:hypothetical protein
VIVRVKSDQSQVAFGHKYDANKGVESEVHS